MQFRIFKEKAKSKRNGKQKEWEAPTVKGNTNDTTEQEDKTDQGDKETDQDESQISDDDTSSESDQKQKINNIKRALKELEQK